MAPAGSIPGDGPVLVLKALPSRDSVRYFILPFLLISLFFYGFVQLQSSLLGEVIVSHEHVRIAGLLGIMLAGTFALVRVSRLKITEPTLAFFLAGYSGYLAVDFALKTAESLDQGEFEQVVIKCAEGTILAAAAGSEAVLLGLYDAEADMSLARFRLKRATKVIEDALGRL